MRPDQHAEVVSLQEGVYVVGTEVDNIVLLERISDMVVLETTDFFALVRVTPEKINDLLMIFDVVRAQLNFKRSLYLLDALDVGDLGTNAAVATEDSLLFISHDGGQGQVVECIVDLGEATVWIINILTKSFCALIAKSQILVHISVFVVTSQHHDLLRVLELQGHQQTDDFQTVLSLIDIVAKEHVVESVDVALIKWIVPNIIESHQIHVLSV